MAVTAGLSGLIKVTDNTTGSTSLTKPLNNFYTGDLSYFAQNLIVGTTPTVISLPNSSAQFVYIRNLSAITGATLTVTWTPTSGVSANVITLDPGAMILFSEVTTSYGISALSLVSNQLGLPIEYIIVG